MSRNGARNSFLEEEFRGAERIEVQSSYHLTKKWQFIYMYSDGAMGNSRGEL
jgi:hypothetical protein